MTVSTSSLPTIRSIAESTTRFDDDYVQDPADAYFIAEGNGESGVEWLAPSGDVACAILVHADQSVVLECRAAEYTWTGSGICISGDTSPQPTSSGQPAYVAGQVLAGSSSQTIGVMPDGHLVNWWGFRCVSLDTGAGVREPKLPARLHDLEAEAQYPLALLHKRFPRGYSLLFVAHA